MNFRYTFGAIALGICGMLPAFAAEGTAAEDAVNHGEDITKPLNRFDIRLQFEALPDDTRKGRHFDDRWIVSLEYQYGLVRDDDSYNQWLGARVGYFS